MDRLTLLLRGLWWRRGVSFALLAVAVVTTTAASLGPLYARASGESILQDHLRQAGTGAQLWFRSSIPLPGGQAADATLARLPAPGSVRGYGRAIAGFQTEDPPPSEYPQFTATPVAHPNATPATKMVWRAGQCAQLVIVRGRCPSAANEAIVSQRLAGTPGSPWTIGSRVRTTGVSPYVTVTPPPALTVVGVYRPRNVSSPFWFGQDFFDRKQTMFVTRSEFTGTPAGSVAELDVVYPLTRQAIRLDTLDAETARVKALQHRFPLQSSAALTTNLPGVLASARHEAGVGATDTQLVTLQLTLLAWLVLFEVVSDAVEARGNEIAMAKLRGHRPLATLRFGMAEPLVLLALAVPVGLLAAFGVVHVFARTTFVPGVPVVLTWSAVFTAVGAFAGGVVALGVAGYRTLTRTVLDQWRRTERRPGRGTVARVVDTALAALAIVALVLVLTFRGSASSGDAAPLLAPALVVFAVSIIGVRLLPTLCRWIARRTRGTRRLGTFLAASQVARRPVGLRLASLLAVAVGLATFGVAAESVAADNRTHRSAAEVGAAQVAQVDFGPRVDPIDATHAADPHGRWAMAAATWLPDGGGSVSGSVLAVDPTRLTTVANPVAGGLPNRVLQRAIEGTGPAPVAFVSRTVRVTLTASDLRGNVAPAVQLNLRTSGQPFLNVEGPSVRDGTHTYTLTTPCRLRCTLQGITWDRPINATTRLSGTITLQALSYRQGSGWHDVDLGLGRAGSWYALRPSGQATDHVVVGANGVTDRFGNINGGFGGIAFGADPASLPAVSTPRALATDASAPAVPTLEDAGTDTAHFHVVRVARALPLVLDSGLLLDARYLTDELPYFLSSANWQVWIGRDAPSDWRARLARAGLHVEQVRTEAARTRLLGRQAPALALLLLLVCSLVGSVLAVGGTAISVSASSRRRSYELAALRTLGVRRRALFRAGVIEQVLLLGAAVVIGVPVGWLAALATMPVIPQFATASPVALENLPGWRPTVLFAAAFVVLLVLTAMVAARALVRSAVPARLREAE